jgi:coproporphyrinogen III oxidase
LNGLTLLVATVQPEQFGRFLKYVDIYFYLKFIPEKRKFPLAARAICGPFAKRWLNAEYRSLLNQGNIELKITRIL